MLCPWQLWLRDTPEQKFFPTVPRTHQCGACILRASFLCSLQWPSSIKAQQPQAGNRPMAWLKKTAPARGCARGAIPTPCSIGSWQSASAGPRPDAKAEWSASFDHRRLAACSLGDSGILALDVQLWLSRDAGRYRALLDQEGKESHVIRRRDITWLVRPGLFNQSQQQARFGPARRAGGMSVPAACSRNVGFGMSANGLADIV